MSLTTVNGGLSGFGGIVGFGGSVVTPGPLGGTIDLSGGANDGVNFAFSVPRNGIITSIAAFFSSTSSFAIPETSISIHAQLYGSAAPNNIFVPITGTALTLSPAYTDNVSAGTIADGILTGLSIPVPARTRLILVFSASASGVTLIHTIAGYGSGGVSIS